MRIRAPGLWVPWVAEIRKVVEGEGFEDVQVRGPFRSWRHAHKFFPDGRGGCTLEDEVRYEPPLGTLGEWLAGPIVRAKLARLFAFRAERLRRDLLLLGRLRGQMPERVAISGASGLLGSALRALLEAGGAEVVRLVRREPSEGEVRWDPKVGVAGPGSLEGFGAVVHLAGEGIAGRRWTPRFKRVLRDSRVEGTERLARALAGLRTPPKVFLCASAVGYYGDRAEEVLTEASPRGEGFLSDLCEAWETAADPARRAGIRTVHLRLGTVLSSRGGALRKMLPPFRVGLGGRLGDGRQWMSWVSLDDAVGAVLHLLAGELEGPVNAVAPEPSSNAQFTRILAKALGRPAPFPVPAFAVKLAFGEMGKELLLSSCGVRPTRLEGSGYAFLDADLEGALRWELGARSP